MVDTIIRFLRVAVLAVPVVMGVYFIAVNMGWL